MDDDALARFLEVYEAFINSLPALVPSFVFLNAIYRNINSGENTVAAHPTPFQDGSGQTRFSGYGKPPPLTDQKVPPVV